MRLAVSYVPQPNCLRVSYRTPLINGFLHSELGGTGKLGHYIGLYRRTSPTLLVTQQLAQQAA